MKLLLHEKNLKTNKKTCPVENGVYYEIADDTFRDFKTDEIVDKKFQTHDKWKGERKIGDIFYQAGHYHIVKHWSPAKKVFAITKDELEANQISFNYLERKKNASTPE